MRRARVSGLLASWIWYRIAYLFLLSSLAKNSRALSFFSSARLRTSTGVPEEVGLRLHATHLGVFVISPVGDPAGVVRSDNATKVRFSATLGQEPEVELVLA